MAVRLLSEIFRTTPQKTRFASTFQGLVISPTFPFRWIVKQERNADSHSSNSQMHSRHRKPSASSTTSLSKGGRSPSTKHEPGRPVLARQAGSVPGLRRLGPAVVLHAWRSSPAAAAPSRRSRRGRLSR